MVGGIPLYLNHVAYQLSNNNSFFYRSAQTLIKGNKFSAASKDLQSLIASIIFEYLLYDEEGKDYNYAILKEIIDAQSMTNNQVPSINTAEHKVPNFLSWIHNNNYIENFLFKAKLVKLANKQFSKIENISELDKILEEKFKIGEEELSLLDCYFDTNYRNSILCTPYREITKILYDKIETFLENHLSGESRQAMLKLASILNLQLYKLENEKKYLDEAKKDFKKALDLCKDDKLESLDLRYYLLLLESMRSNNGNFQSDNLSSLKTDMINFFKSFKEEKPILLVKAFKLRLKFYELVLQKDNDDQFKENFFKLIEDHCKVKHKKSSRFSSTSVSSEEEMPLEKPLYYYQAKVLKAQYNIHQMIRLDRFSKSVPSIISENLCEIRSCNNILQNQLNSSEIDLNIKILSHISNIKTTLRNLDFSKSNYLEELKKNIYYLVLSEDLDGVKKWIAELSKDVNAKDSNGDTPLHYASEKGHLEIVAKLIEKGAEVNAQNNKRVTPLHDASFKGHVKVVAKLIEKGAEVNVQSKKKVTPLHDASAKGRVKVVEKLIDAGAKVNVQSENGVTPLHNASVHGHVKVVKKLIEAGAMVNVQTEKGFTSLHEASYNGHIAVVEKLIDAGAKVNVQSENGVMPLHDASAMGRVKVVEKLIDAGAKVKEKTQEGFTPLHIASYNGHRDVVEKLIEKSADVNAKNGDGCTPLHYASGKGYIEIVEELIQRDADVNAKDSNDDTPLHYASEHGHIKLVEKLIEHEAKILKNTLGKTALDIAKKKFSNLINTSDKEKFSEIKTKIENYKKALNQITAIEPSNDDVISDKNIFANILEDSNITRKNLSKNESKMKTITPTDKGGINGYKTNMNRWYSDEDMDVVGTRLLAKLKDRDGSQINTDMQYKGRLTMDVIAELFYNERVEDNESNFKEGSPLYIAFNLGGQSNKDSGSHWVAMCAIRNDNNLTILYKDSFGETSVGAIRKEFKRQVENLNLEVEFISHPGSEQTDGSACGPMTLRNLEIMAQHIQNYGEQSLINNYISLVFSKQSDVQNLRNKYATISDEVKTEKSTNTNSDSISISNNQLSWEGTWQGQQSIKEISNALESQSNNNNISSTLEGGSGIPDDSVSTTGCQDDNAHHDFE